MAPATLVAPSLAAPAVALATSAPTDSLTCVLAALAPLAAAPATVFPALPTVPASSSPRPIGDGDGSVKALPPFAPVSFIF